MVMDGGPHARLTATEPSTETIVGMFKHCAFGSITNHVNDNCVCQYGLLLRILPPPEAPVTQDRRQAH